MEAVAEQELSVVLSSHLVSDVERSCDYLIVLVDSRVQVSGEIDTLLATHFRLIGPRRDAKDLPQDQHVVTESHTDRQSTYLIRTDQPILDPAWNVTQLTLEDLVLAYMGRARPARASGPGGAAMIWLTWRQFRVQFLVVASVIAAAAIVLAVTGPGLLDDYQRLHRRLHQEPRLRAPQPAALHRRPGARCTPSRR